VEAQRFGRFRRRLFANDLGYPNWGDCFLGLLVLKFSLSVPTFQFFTRPRATADVVRSKTHALAGASIPSFT